MKPIKNMFREVVRNRRGNALVLAILTTMLLFIIGMVFLSSTMTERATTISVDQDAYLDNGIDVVIDRINEVLTDDLFKYGGNKLMGGNSAYDYPDRYNSWLASLEPEFYPGGVIPTVIDESQAEGVDQDRPAHYYWRHITDLWNRFSDGKPDTPWQDCPNYYDPDIYDDSSPDFYTFQDQANGMDGTVDAAMYLVSDSFVPIRVVLEDEEIRSPVLNLVWEQNGGKGPSWWEDLSGYPFSTSRISGMRADADGDGLADSRWVRLYRIGPEGQFLWVAVRIIDPGGMLNINTAFRNPEDLNEGADPSLTMPQWDGSQLSHVDLIPFRASTEAYDVLDLQAFRTGSVATIPTDDYQHDIQYEAEVGQRVLNPFYDSVAAPTEIYQPFDIFDELELRNRYLMFSNVEPRCATIWQKTFNPGIGGVGIQNPYIDDILLSYAYYGGDKNSIDQWFDKVKPDWDQPSWVIGDSIIGDYNRRHLATTYNFDRITRRGDDTSKETKMKNYPGSRKVPVRLPDDGNGRGVGAHSGFDKPDDKEDYIRYLACAIYRGLPSDKEVKARFGDDYDTKEKLAWHWALNLIDAQDTNSSVDEPSYYPRKDSTDYTRYFGVESMDNLKHIALQVSKLGFVQFPPYNPADPEPDSNANYPDGGEFYAVEVFDPNDGDYPVTNKKDLDRYELWVVNKDDELKFTLELSGTISDSNPTDYTGDTELFVFYDEDANDVLVNNPALDETNEINDAFGTTYISGPFTVVAPSEVIKDDLLEDEDKIYVMYRLSDGKFIPVDVVEVPSSTVTGNGPNVEIRRVSLPNTHFLLPTADTKANFDPWSIDKPLTANRLGDDIDPGDTLNGLIPITDTLAAPYDVSFKGFDRIQHISESWPLRTLGEILDVPAVGFRHVAETGSSPEKHTCTTYWKALIESAVAIKSPDPDADKELDEELGSYGKVRLDDPVFMKYNHTTNPNNRRIDANIFGLLTWFDPSNDGVDNDGNPYTQDNPSKTDAKNYEQTVAGRININTAPWFVIAQLPWMTPELARAIVAYRDKTALTTVAGTVIDYATCTWTSPPEDALKTRKFGMGLQQDDPDIREEPGFADIYELINVTHDLRNDRSTDPTKYDDAYDIRRYGCNSVNDDDNADADTDGVLNYAEGPFYDSAADTVTDDMEERDILFKRISNLVTVRSDVFTAYILVRLGRDGPQKRVIAIFDRSNVYSQSDKPKLIALHTIPDPR